MKEPNVRRKKKLKQGKSAKLAAGGFVHEEMKHYEQGKHGKSRKQAVAIGISQARRHGVPYPQRSRSEKNNDREINRDRTKSSLYNQAKNMGIQGRSKMNKELAKAIKKTSG